MKYARFEDVPVWQAGLELAVGVFDITGVPSWRGKGDLANQLQRAALSVSNNIAEGFERGTTAELLTFLYYAKGSAGEARSICHVALRVRGMEDLRSQISKRWRNRSRASWPGGRKCYGRRTSPGRSG